MNHARAIPVLDQKNVRLGWVYDPSKGQFYPPKNWKECSSSEDRKYEIECIITQDEWNTFKRDEDFEEWHKYVSNHSAELTFHVKLSADIERSASESSSNKSGQKIVQSLSFKKYIHIFILLNKRGKYPYTTCDKLKTFLNSTLNGKTEAFDTPESLTDGLITTYLFNKNHNKEGIESSNVFYSLREGCRIIQEEEVKPVELKYVTYKEYSSSNDLNELKPKGVKYILDTQQDPKTTSANTLQIHLKYAKTDNHGLEIPSNESVKQPRKNANTLADVHKTNTGKVTDTPLNYSNPDIKHKANVLTKDNKSVVTDSISNNESKGMSKVDNISASNHDTTGSYKKLKVDEKRQSQDALDNLDSPYLATKTSNVIRITPTRIITDKCGIDKQLYGECSNDLDNLEEKVIILLGASGSGKTTLVNFFANYFEGVQTPDDKMVCVESIPNRMRQSHTKDIKAYSFCSKLEPRFVFTIIDTPGLNDSSGSEVREHVHALKTYLVNLNENKVKVHALGFVAQAHLVRLTSSERLVMDYVSKLFGENVGDNILTFVTFCDNQENPPIVEAIQQYGVKVKQIVTFNNAILSSNEYTVDDLDRVYWRKGCKSLKKVIKLMKVISPICEYAMKDLQNEVYSKTVVAGALKDLKAGVESFIKSLQNKKDRDQIRNASCHVWELATAGYIQCIKTNNKCTSVEDLVSKTTIEVCHKMSISHCDCLKYLSLSPNRGMKPASFATISSLNMVYEYLIERDNYARTYSDRLKKHPNGKHSRKHCYKCKEEHIMEHKKIWKMGGPDTFSDQDVWCLMCKCDKNVHAKNLGISSDDNLAVNGIVQHAKRCLHVIIERYSIPEVSLTYDELLQFLMEEMTQQYQPFICNLIKKQNNQ